MSLATKQILGLLSGKAEAAIANNVFVTQGTNGNEVITAGAGEVILGVSNRVTAINKGNSRVVSGITTLWISGAITADTRLKSDASGYGVAVTTDFDEYGAIALEDGTDCVISVQVAPLSIYGV